MSRKPFAAITGNIPRATNRLWKGEDGAIFAYFALIVPVVLGMIGLALDVGGAYLERQNMQHAADAAAIAGRLALTQGANPANVGKATAAYLGFRNVAINCAANSCDAPISATTSAYSADSTAVQAVVTKNRAVPFAKLFDSNKNWQILTRATVRTDPTGSNYCILVLGVGTATAGSCNGGDEAFTGDGGVSFGTPSCGTAVNSNSSDAVEINGSSATAAGPISVCGGIDANRNLIFQSPPNTNTNTAVLDPYDIANSTNDTRNWATDSSTGTDLKTAEANLDSSSVASLKNQNGPNKYASFSSGTLNDAKNYSIGTVNGGVLDGAGGGRFYIDTLAGGTVQNGVFYVNQITAASNITSTNATIVLMNPTSGCSGGLSAPCSRITGNTTLNLNAPSSNTTSNATGARNAGIALTSAYPYSLEIGGNASLNVSGAIYFPVTARPGSYVSLRGTSSACAQVIAARVNLSGNVNLATNNTCGISNITGAPGYAQAVE